MLTIDVPDTEFYVPATNEFVTVKGKTLQLEHSLISISKWESKWKKAFLKKDPDRTAEQHMDYIRCMTLTQNVDPKVYRAITPKNQKEINDYVNDPMTATHFNRMEQSKTGIRRDTVTSELIYYWMVALNIPFECQKWHLNRLLTLIEVCNVKNSPPSTQKTPRRQLAKNWASLNAARRAQLGSKG